MLIPIMMAGLLILPYLVARLLRLPTEDRNYAGVLGLTAVFLFTGAGHFIKTESMVDMLPLFVPQRALAVQVSGAIEIGAALALLIPGLRHRVGQLLLWMLLLLLPVNVYAAFNQIPLGGHAWGPIYLLIRVPLQLLLMLWTYRFALQLEPRKP